MSSFFSTRFQYIENGAYNYIFQKFKGGFNNNDDDDDDDV